MQRLATNRGRLARDDLRVLNCSLAKALTSDRHSVSTDGPALHGEGTITYSDRFKCCCRDDVLSAMMDAFTMTAPEVSTTTPVSDPVTIPCTIADIG